MIARETATGRRLSRRSGTSTVFAGGCADNETHSSPVMDAGNANIISQHLHHLLVQLSSLQNSASQSSHIPDSLVQDSTYNSSVWSRAWSRRHINTLPRTPSPRSVHAVMGIRGTDDYLTARAANPRTGLISPSIANLTPRTPLSPAEALSLYADNHGYSPDPSPTLSSPQQNQTDRQKPAGPRGRWRQDDKGWTMQTVTECGSPRMMNTANSSAMRADFHANEDAFVIPMPSAKDPQPYLQADQDEAVQYYRDKGQRLSQKEGTDGMNGRMHSVSAGPRKFAQATKALRDFSGARCSPANEAPSPSLSASSEVSMPGSFGSPKSPQLSKRPVGSALERKDSGTSIKTSKSAQEKEVFMGHSPTLGSHDDHPHSNSNTLRFQDLRQLPRVRIVHPKDAGSKGRQICQSPIPPPSYTTISSRKAPSGSGTSVADSLSPLEAQVIGFLAWSINRIFCNATLSKSDADQESHSIGIARAIHILSDSATTLLERWQAIKALVFIGLRAVVMLGCIVAVIRLGVAVGRVLAIILWPVRLVWMVLKWILGFG
jgi:hypothetical protein